MFFFRLRGILGYRILSYIPIYSVYYSLHAIGFSAELYRKLIFGDAMRRSSLACADRQGGGKTDDYSVVLSVKVGGRLVL